jgi:gas vesicle protein
MTTGRAFLGVVAGIAAGAALGALFSPGSRSRKNISKKGEDLANALNEKIDKKFDELLNAIAGRVKKTRMTDESEASAGNS